MKRQTSVARVLASLLLDGGWWRHFGVTMRGAPLGLWRAWRLKHKFERERWTLRSDDATARDSEKTGPRVALMTFSWGEVKTVEPLALALRAARPDARLIFTIKRHEALEAATQLADEPVLPLPFDSALPVARWHARARPDLVVFYEQVEPPTLARSLWLRRVPFLVVHARVNAQSAAARSKAQTRLEKWRLRGLGTMLLATPEALPATQPVSPATAQLKVVGSLKFPHQKPCIAPEKAADLRAWIAAATQGRPLLAAGSTHEPEEDFVLDALQIVRENRADNAPVLLIAPRKTFRGDAIAALLQKRGVSFSRRSQWTPDAPATSVEVLLLDTLGELMAAYEAAIGAFVGGTLLSDSHNVAEPLIWSIPVAYGPKRGNFETEQLLCEGAGVGFRVHTPGELAAHWTALVESPALRAQFAEKTDALITVQKDAFERTLQVLIEAVDAVSR